MVYAFILLLLQPPVEANVYGGNHTYFRNEPVVSLDSAHAPKGCEGGAHKRQEIPPKKKIAPSISEVSSIAVRRFRLMKWVPRRMS